MRKINIYPLSTRVDKDGGPVRSPVRDEPGQGRSSLKQSNCQNILILVHGFNNAERVAEQSFGLFYSRLEEHFSLSNSAPDAVAYFHWPGNYYRGSARLAFAWYHIDVLRAREAAAQLAQYLTEISNSMPRRVTLVGHSLGCRLILETLTMLASPNPNLKIDLISLMAPAVPVALVERADPARRPAGALNATVIEPRQVLKFHSWRDLALSGGFPIGQLNAYRYLGPNGEVIETQAYAEAVGLLGRPSDVGTSIPTTNGHSDYWGDVRTAADLRSALDPRYFSLPAPHQTPDWKIEGAPPLEERELPRRR